MRKEFLFLCLRPCFLEFRYYYIHFLLSSACSFFFIALSGLTDSTVSLDENQSAEDRSADVQHHAHYFIFIGMMLIGQESKF